MPGQPNSSNASVIEAASGISSDVAKMTRAEVKTLIPILEMLKRGDLGQVQITNNTGTITFILDRTGQMLARSLSVTIADTTLAQTFTLRIAKHTFIQFLNALRGWGNNVSEFRFDVNNVPGFTASVRFQLAAGS